MPHCQTQPQLPSHVVISGAALDAIVAGDIAAAVRRHVGATDAEDGDQAGESPPPIFGNARVLSSFRDRNGTTFWILTEADGESTSILLPSEF